MRAADSINHPINDKKPPINERSGIFTTIVAPLVNAANKRAQEPKKRRGIALCEVIRRTDKRCGVKLDVYARVLGDKVLLRGC